MKYAIVDIGSNTIRMVMYRVHKNRIEYLLNSEIIAKLANYIENNRMKIEGVAVLIDAIKEHKELATHHRLDNIRFFATAPLRVNNADDVLAAVYEATGEKIDVLTGEQEAICGMKGISYNLDVSNCLCLDLGGGSLEISQVLNGEIQNMVSLPIGSVIMSKKAVKGILPTYDEVEFIQNETLKYLEKVEWLKNNKFDIAYLVGGTARSMIKMHKVYKESEQEMHGYRLFTCDISKVYNYIIKSDIQGIRLIDQHCAGRLFSFIPGLIIIKTALSYADIPIVRLSQYGVREGYLLDYVIN